MGLTVVTHTNPKKTRDISKCLESVKAALPENARHEVIELATATAIEYAQARHKTMLLDDIVVFVDDDDYIAPDSLWMCLEAINKTDAGLAFTNEVIVAPDLTERIVSHSTKYELIGITTQIIHHMAMFRTKCVTSKSLDLAVKFECGIEWAMRSQAAFAQGAVHVPIPGYYWVHHAGQHHKDPEVLRVARKNLDQVGSEIRSWSDRKGAVPVWLPER